MAEPIKAHCPACNGERACDVHGQKVRKWEHDDGQNYAHGEITHSLLECRGCATVFYENSNWSDQDIDHFYDAQGETQGSYTIFKETHPKPETSTAPAWLSKLYQVDEAVFTITKEIYAAFENDCYAPTAIGLRTSLDRATEYLKIDAALTFEEKLNELFDLGWIGNADKDLLQVLTEAGHAAAHRKWDPSKKDLKQLISVYEVFLNRVFIIGKSAMNLTASIPPKQKRRPKASTPAAPPTPSPLPNAPASAR